MCVSEDKPRDCDDVIAGHSASEDARERAYDPAILPFNESPFFDGCAGRTRA
jgi:hypothetical protein